MYDDAGRLVCSEYNGTALEYLKYEGNQRKTRYRNPGSNCQTLGTDPEAYLVNVWGYRKTTYTYEGNRLVEDEGFYCLPGCALSPSPAYTRNFEYDGDGNIKKLTLYRNENNSTTIRNYEWEAGTHRLTRVTQPVNGNEEEIASFEYDNLGRIRQFCRTGAASCDVFSYIGNSDWLSVVKDPQGGLKARYLYANGRPLRVDIWNVWWVNPWYFVYTARGDYAGFIGREKTDALNWSTLYGAWGDMSFQDGSYYTWNAQEGYMQFPSSLIAVPGDVLDGFYYAHGRWYMADIGLWLSPNEKGEYLYGGDRQDPVNKGWMPLLTPQQQQEIPDHGYIHTRDWGFFDINHINGGRVHAQQIMNHMNDLTSPNPLPIINQVGRLGIVEELTVRYNINRPISGELRASVALSIFLDYENRFERFQGRSPYQVHSSYSIEDLPSDYLGFFNAVSGTTIPIILDNVLQEKASYSISDDKPLWLGTPWSPDNYDINPMICSLQVDGNLGGFITCDPRPWPDAMRINPIATPELYWQVADCMAERRYDIGPIHHVEQLPCD